MLLPALERIAAGATIADPRAVGVLTVACGPHPGDSAWSDPGLASLSPRERDVLRLMTLGRTNSAIAGDLCVSPGTVEKRVAAIFTKLGLNGGDGENRRVLSVLRLLSAQGQGAVPAPEVRTARRPHLTRAA
ncbi:response regulator transcription factor [Streptomyces desertarenae]|uniref:Response regulator transcription factor n=1 Tax=Streptomyces desertarenae TaxID=2666184 RepID=A0ABW4PPC4_9ACTN